jgi:hypothetical protein
VAAAKGVVAWEAARVAAASAAAATAAAARAAVAREAATEEVRVVARAVARGAEDWMVRG